jgi:mono/diheme cytochrome c family protein
MQKRNRLIPTRAFTAASALITPLAFMAASLLFGQAGNDSSLQLESGEQIYKSACIACHGSDARGTPKSISAFEPPRTFQTLRNAIRPRLNQTQPGRP